MLVKCTDSSRSSTYNLIYHDQYPRLGVLTAFHVTKEDKAESVFNTAIHVAMSACRLDVHLFRIQEEDVCLGPVGDFVHVSEHIYSRNLTSDCIMVHDKAGLDIDGCGTLSFTG